MKQYIDDNADIDLSELIKLLRGCAYAVIDNDCIYFTSEDGYIYYEVTATMCNRLLLTLLGVESEVL